MNNKSQGEEDVLGRFIKYNINKVFIHFSLGASLERKTNTAMKHISCLHTSKNKIDSKLENYFASNQGFATLALKIRTCFHFGPVVASCKKAPRHQDLYDKQL